MSGLDRVSGMHRAFEFVFKSDVYGDYWEFGVARGHSLYRAWENWREFSQAMNRMHDMRFVAFDSFEGIPPLQPEDQLATYEVFQPGQYAHTRAEVAEWLQAKGVDLQRFTFVEGFYEDALGRPETAATVAGTHAAIVHIDCDLYSSATHVLDFIAPHLVEGSVLLFDDWFCYRGRRDKGVHGAFRVWLERSRWSAEEYFRYDWPGICFIMVDYTSG